MDVNLLASDVASSDLTLVESMINDNVPLVVIDFSCALIVISYPFDWFICRQSQDV